MYNLIPVIIRHGRKGCVAGNPGITDHTIVGTVFFQACLELLATGKAVTDIELHQVCFTTSTLNLCQDLPGFLFTGAIMEGDVKPVLG